MKRRAIRIGLLAMASWAMAWAMAGDPAGAQGRSASAIRVSVGGYMEQSVGYAWNRDGVRVAQTRQTGTTAVVVARPNRWGQQSDSEIWFSGRARLASGLLVGFTVQLEANTQFGDQIDESYLFIEGAFGRVLLGAENDVAYLQHVGPPRPGNGWGVLESAVTGWVNTPRSMFFLTTTAPLSTGDDQKISYFTPRFGGVQAGVSFTPNDKQDVREFSDRTRERTNLASFSANGRWQPSDFRVDASAGWVHGAAVPEAAFSDRRTPLDDVAAGAQLHWRAWSAGAAYRSVRNPGGASAGEAVAAGLARRWERAALGVSGLASKTAGTASTPGHDRGRILLISGSYELGPGVAAIGSVFAARFESGASKAPREDNNRGAGAVAGIRLSF